MRLARATAAAALALGLAASSATAQPATGRARTHRVLIVVVPAADPTAPASTSLAAFAADRQLNALGLLSSTVGHYHREQSLLDVTQSARVPQVDYSPRSLPPLAITRTGMVRGWRAIEDRAASAHATLEPGLLASSVPGGGAYASATTRPSLDALLVAGRSGQIGAVSLGSRGTLLARTSTLIARYRFVVVDLASGLAGRDELRALLAARRPTELLLALQQPPATTRRSAPAAALLALGAAGLTKRQAALTTQTTRIDGLVTALDLAPTILRWLGRPLPGAFVGEPITAGAPRTLASLRAFEARLRVVEGRRTPAILAFLAAWLALLLTACAARRGVARALRLGGLAALWLPSTALLSAALEPHSAAVETAIVVGVAYALALATDRLLPWPRGPALAVGVMLALYTVDLARGSPLIDLSLLGANPISGSRFFGVGNELEALFPIELFAGLAAALPQRAPRRREVVAFAGAGAALTAIVAWGRLGADAGAIFTIGGGSAIATALLAPGRITVRRLALAAGATLAALAALALLDLITGGGAHFTRAVIHAHSGSALLDTLGRRLREAYHVLLTGAVWAGVLVCVAVAAAVIAFRRRVLAPVAAAPAWTACLGGGLAGSLLGSVANDSGPRLLLIGCFVLACVLAYVRGAPRRGV